MALMTQQDALKYVVKKKWGYIHELEERIGSEMTERFKSVGFIKMGVAPDSRRTWARTESARSFLKSYKPTIVDLLSGLFFTRRMA
jgi:hypothetical protein